MSYLWFDSVESVIKYIKQHSIKYPKKEYIIILKGQPILQIENFNKEKSIINNTKIKDIIVIDNNACDSKLI